MRRARPEHNAFCRTDHVSRLDRPAGFALRSWRQSKSQLGQPLPELRFRTTGSGTTEGALYLLVVRNIALRLFNSIGESRQFCKWVAAAGLPFYRRWNRSLSAASNAAGS